MLLKTMMFLHEGQSGPVTLMPAPAFTVAGPRRWHWTREQNSWETPLSGFGRFRVEGDLCSIHRRPEPKSKLPGGIIGQEARRFPGGHFDRPDIDLRVGARCLGQPVNREPLAIGAQVKIEVHFPGSAHRPHRASRAIEPGQDRDWLCFAVGRCTSRPVSETGEHPAQTRRFDAGLSAESHGPSFDRAGLGIERLRHQRSATHEEQIARRVGRVADSNGPRLTMASAGVREPIRSSCFDPMSARYKRIVLHPGGTRATGGRCRPSTGVVTAVGVPPFAPMACSLPPRAPQNTFASPAVPTSRTPPPRAARLAIQHSSGSSSACHSRCSRWTDCRGSERLSRTFRAGELPRFRAQQSSYQ